MRPRHKRSPAAGFTLLEAMVALIIVALGMMAVHTQLNQYVATSIYIQDKTLASWIASNQLTELSIEATWPGLGIREDEIEFADRRWFYRIEIGETGVPNLRRADIAVSLADSPERVLHRVSAFIEPPPPAGFVPLRWWSGGEAG